jgi:hypothetical protein
MHRHVPPSLLTSAIPTLKALGAIDSDGVTIRVRRVPVRGG